MLGAAEPHPRRRPEGRLGSSLSRVCIIVRISNIHFNRPFYKKGTVWHCAEQYLFLWTLWRRQNRSLPSLGRSSGRSKRPCGPGVFGSPVFNRLFQNEFLHLYGVSGLANANPSQTAPFIKSLSLPASHPSPRLTTYSHRRSGKNAVRPGSRFHSYRASPHQTAFSLSGNGMITAFPVVASDAINLSIPDSLSISFALVSSNKWT